MPADQRPTSWSEQDKYRAAEEAAGQRPVLEPFSVPEGYKPPTMKEQWLYATRRHPYYRYGYGVAVLVGLGAYTFATARREPPPAERDRGKEKS